MKPDVRQSVRLIAVLAAAGLAIAFASIALLYNAAIHQQGERLRGMAQSYARLIEATAAHEERWTHAVSLPAEHGDAYHALLDQLRDAQQGLQGFARTGELKVGRRVGDSIVYVVAHRGNSVVSPPPVPFGSSLAQPMYHALSGRSGAGILVDYRGAKVLAAYEPVRVFGLGVVAKLDLAEVQAPFVDAGLIALAATLVFVVGGGLLLLVATAPERRRLREAEKRYQQLFEGAPIGIYRTTPEGRVLMANPALLRMLGYDSYAELAERNIETEGFGPEYPRSRFKEQIETHGEVRGIEVIWRRRDGTDVWMRENARCVRDGSGRALFYEGTVEDISDRKRAEAALRESEEQFRATFEQAAVGIARVSLEGRFMRVNQRFCDIAGRTRDELLASTFQDITHPDDLESDLFNVRQVLAGSIETYSMEKRYIRKDGSHVWVNLTVSLMREPDGRPKHFISVIEDFSARKRAEEALRESESRFRQLANSLPQLVWTCAPDGPCDFLSNQWIEFTGIPAEPQLGFGWLEQLHPEDREPTVAAWNAAVASGSDFHVEFRIRRHDGEYRWFDTRAVRLRDAEGRTAKWFGTNTDITDRKRAEDERARLAREVERRAVELEQLIYAASHDLRTPLVGVQGFVGELDLSLADLLAELTRTDVPPEFRNRIEKLVKADIPESLKFIDAGIARMSMLLSGLLRLSRLGRAAFRAELLDVNRVVGEVVRSLEFTAREAVAKIEVADLPACVGDPVQIGQVISNLIENALKYRCPDRPLVVRISGRREDDTAVYCIEDNGIGIAPEHRQRVFTPFFRVDPRVADGDGLGLTIVTRIVERLGGRAWVESELGKGSSFFVALPAGK